MPDFPVAGLIPLRREQRQKFPKTTPRSSPNHGGNSTYIVTDEHRQVVLRLRGVGVGVPTIALLLEVDEMTVRKYFPHEVEHGKELTKAIIGGGVAERAIGGDNAASFFYLKNHGGPEWKDTQRLEHSGPDGGPMTVQTIRRVIVDPAVKD